MRVRTLSICLPEEVFHALEKAKIERRDPSRSDTVRTLLVKVLADLSYLPEETRKATE